MIRDKLYKIGIIIALIMSVGLTGCKSDDSDDDDDDKTQTGDSGDNGKSTDSGVSEDDDGFTGVVRDVVSNQAVPDIEVVPLSNDVDFKELSDKVTTDSEGKFTFKDLDDGLMCVKVVATEGDNARVDTYTCNIPTDQKDITVSSLPFAIADGISKGLYPDTDPDPTMASASGILVYETKDGNMIPVDCATIEVEDETQKPDIFYFEGLMPDEAATQTDSGGRFLVTRLNPGAVTLNALVDGEKIGSTTIPIQAPADSDATYNSNITRIIADDTGDPTPDPACGSE